MSDEYVYHLTIGCDWGWGSAGWDLQVLSVQIPSFAGIINPVQLQPCTQFCFLIHSPPHALLITMLPLPQQQNLKLEIIQPTQSAIIIR